MKLLDNLENKKLHFRKDIYKNFNNLIVNNNNIAKTDNKKNKIEKVSKITQTETPNKIHLKLPFVMNTPNHKDIKLNLLEEKNSYDEDDIKHNKSFILFMNKEMNKEYKNRRQISNNFLSQNSAHSFILPKIDKLNELNKYNYYENYLNLFNNGSNVIKRFFTQEQKLPEYKVRKIMGNKIIFSGKNRVEKIKKAHSKLNEKTVYIRIDEGEITDRLDDANINVDESNFNKNKIFPKKITETNKKLHVNLYKNDSLKKIKHEDSRINSSLLNKNNSETKIFELYNFKNKEDKILCNLINDNKEKPFERRYLFTNEKSKSVLNNYDNESKLPNEIKYIKLKVNRLVSGTSTSKRMLKINRNKK